MKKQAKAKAVEKGTFYECGWCGKEGTNAPCGSDVKKVVCGRMVEEGKNYFCSEKCQHIYCGESNRREIIRDIDFANEILDDIKKIVADFIKEGEKISPPLLQMAKLLNIYKKVLTLIISGDKPSARKLYNEKKAIVTDCAEDLLADKVWTQLYMVFINKFAELDELLSNDCSI
jgi:predicted nucleic acid-binding Zn ribbon protein